MVKPIATIFGGTGAQGGSVVDAVLADGTFSARVVTRRPDSEAALKLKSRGVEIVKADLNSPDTAALDKAVYGTQVLFCITSFWDSDIFGTKEDAEVEHGKRIIDAAKKADVKFTIWSSLTDIIKVSKGKYKHVHHFNNKIYVDEYLAQSGLPYAIIKTSWYAENLLTTFNTLVQTADGHLEFPAPKYNPTATQVITWCSSDIGRAVLALFKNYDTKRDEVVGKTFSVAGSRMTYPEFAEILAKEIGKPVRVTYPETTGLVELDEMYEFMVHYGVFPDETLPDPKLLKLGVDFSPLNEFAREFVKPKFA